MAYTDQEDRVYHYPGCWRKDQRAAAVCRKMGVPASCPAAGCVGTTSEVRLVDGGATRLLYQVTPGARPAAVSAPNEDGSQERKASTSVDAVAAAADVNRTISGSDEGKGEQSDGSGGSDDSSGVTANHLVRTPTFVAWSDKSQPVGSNVR